jgi:OmpA-OmpF porin, OOP family
MPLLASTAQLYLNPTRDKKRSIMKKFAIAVVLSAFVAAPALADNTGNFYVAGDFGAATYSNVAPFPNPSVVRIAGGFHFSPVFAVELGYSMFGDSNAITSLYGPATLSASSFQVAAVASLPLSRQFDLIGKLGLASNREDYSDATGYTASWSQNDLLIGFGAQFHVNSQVSLRALYDNYGKFDNFFPPMKASSFSLGVAYDF